MRTAALAALLLVLSAASGARALEKPAQQGSQDIRIVVGYASGGGYDVYARVVAQHLGKHMRGVATMTVQNMPGGDGLIAANYMAQIAPKDGSVLGLTNRNFAVAPLLGMLTESSVRYDPAEFNWVANLNSEVSVFLLRSELGVGHVRDLKDKAIKLGATGVTANNAVYPKVINRLMGAHLQVVSGYPGANHVILAVERGEIDGIGGFSWTGLQAQRPNWLKEKKVLAILKFGETSLPELKEVPSVLDLAQTTDEREALALIVAPERMGRSFFLPPQTPMPIVDRFRQGFSEMTVDPEFKSAAVKSGLEVNFTDGEAVQRYVAQLNGAPPRVIELARELIK